jgi:hypothetical protein
MYKLEPGKGRQRVQFSLYAYHIDELDELVELTKKTEGPYLRWRKAGRSSVVCELIQKGLAAKKIEMAQEADTAAAAANARSNKPAAANRIPIDGQLELPIGRKRAARKGPQDA